MSNHQDDIARRAASLIEKQPNIPVMDAISLAVEQLGLPHEITPPPFGLVRRHAEALAMSRLGEQGYAERRHQRLVAIIDVMRRLETDFPAARISIVGRASDGHFDADPHVHLRFIGETAVHLIADALVRARLPDPHIQTFSSRVGVLEQLHTEFPFAPLTLTRCPPNQFAHPELDLHTGKPIRQRTILQLEELIAK